MLGICVPVRDTLHSGFAYCLSQLTAHLVASAVEFKLYFENGSMISDQRYRLVMNAQADNCTQILWLDSDMLFPVSIYSQLNSHDQLVTAGTYSTRTAPYRNTTFGSSEFDVVKHDTGLHQAYAVGMGLMLTDIRVFDKIPRPWFKVAWSHKLDTFIGEDIYFCEQLNTYEIDLWVDYDLSNQCGHIGSKAIKMEDTNDANGI